MLGRTRVGLSQAEVSTALGDLRESLRADGYDMDVAVDVAGH